MDIKSFELSHVQLPLKFTFKTAKTVLNVRDTLIIKITGKSGLCGYGEVVAFVEPFYTTETLNGSLDLLINSYIPKVLNANISHPFDIHNLFDLSTPMTLAGLENALLDLYAKEQGQNIISMLFQEKLKAHIDMGIVFGHMPYAELEKKVEHAIGIGCSRFKFKIFPCSDNEPYNNIKKIHKKFPHISLLADANKSFSLNANDISKIEQYNSLPLECVEEVFNTKQLHQFSKDDFVAYAKAIKNLNFTICHDESLLTLKDMQMAHENNILQMINIKIGRLGGLYYTHQVINFCRKNNIAYFIGSMVESGISKILHVQLAALEGVKIAGDLSDSTRYFANDIIVPAISSSKGKIAVPHAKGLGVEIDLNILKTHTKNTWIFNK